MRPGTPTAIDLFSGPGGLTQGLKQAGFRVVAAVELDPLAAKTLQYNHPEVLVCQEDIRNSDPAAILKSLGLDRIDLVAGCPPCQGFSTVRTRNAADAVKDARNDLIDEYVRFVEVLKPRAVILENVPGLGRDKLWKDAALRLEKLGYPAREGMKILKRRGLRSPAAPSPLGHGRALPRRRGTGGRARGRAPHRAPGIRRPSQPRGVRRRATRPAGEIAARRSWTSSAPCRTTAADGSTFPRASALECHKGFDGFKDVYGRMRWDAPSATITGGCHNPSKGRFLHPEKDRTITLREAALLQGFPPRYYFALDRGKLAAATMIGNALPPAFIEAQATPIFRVLSETAA